ncbi:hypothetical protein ACFL34_01815 [Candidatus Sumerlaeota bacterium]
MMLDRKGGAGHHILYDVAFEEQAVRFGVIHPGAAAESGLGNGGHCSKTALPAAGKRAESIPKTGEFRIRLLMILR